MSNQHPIIQFNLRQPTPSDSLPFTRTDLSSYTSQYSTWLTGIGGGNNIFKTNGESVTLYGAEATYYKNLIDSGKIGGTYRVIDKVIEGNLTKYFLHEDSSCWAMSNGSGVDHVWGMDRLHGGMWKVTKTGDKTFYDADVTGIDCTLGYDGNIWIASGGIGAGIVRINADGTYDQFNGEIDSGSTVP